jgi:hypothetical protein
MTKKKKAITFPAKDALFDGAFRGLVTDLGTPDTTSSSPAVDTYTRLGISGPGVYTPLVNLLGTPTTVNSWEYVYPLVKNKATYTKPLNDRKKAIKKAALAIIRPQRLILKELEKATPGILTNNDMNMWYIPLPATHTPSIDKVISEHPVPSLTIHEIKANQHIIDTRDPKVPDSKEMPAGMQFVWLKCFVGATPPADHNQYTHVIFSGKFRNLSTFTAASKKQTSWYIAAYISKTGVLGTFCDPVSVNIA